MSDIRERLLHLIEHLEHVLPAQAPIKDFVHHNTLHGYQHMNFEEALIASEKMTGAKGYLSHEKFRAFYQNNRITRQNIVSVLKEDEDKGIDEYQLDKLYFSSTLTRTNSTRTVSQLDIILQVLIRQLAPVTSCQLNWLIEEMSALTQFNEMVDASTCQQIIANHYGALPQEGFSSHHFSHKQETEVVGSLWQATLKVLELEYYLYHPEDMIDMSPDQAEEMLSDEILKDLAHSRGFSQTNRQVKKESRQVLGSLLEKVGKEITLTGFIKALTGVNALENIQPVVQRYIASFLDQGMAPWHHSQQNQGFYTFWKQSAEDDFAWIFEELEDWKDNLHDLPDDPLDTIIMELRQLGIAEEKWTDYLQRLSLDIPGWSGMFLWRHNNPGYDGNYPINMLDYMAVRLVLERWYCQRICTEFWRVEANIDTLRYYFRHRSSEFLVRYTLYHERLPEYLSSLAAHQVERAKTDFVDYHRWENLAHIIWTWQHSQQGSLPELTKFKAFRVSEHAWPLFNLFQHLGLSAADVAQFDKEKINEIFSLMNKMQSDTGSFVWLRAYELNYHEKYFNTLIKNEGRGRWKKREHTPDAQLVFCMDDREEGIRRHLEEINPNIETFGAAAFFGLPINWQGLDDKDLTSLCPVVVDPTHQLKEEIRLGEEAKLLLRQKRRDLRLQAKNILFHETRRGLLSSAFVMALTAPLNLVTLAGKLFFPREIGEKFEQWKAQFDKPVETQVKVNCDHKLDEPTPLHQQEGYSDTEQADKIEGFLRNIGLINGFSPFIIMVGHGSISQNNPHLSAYDCGACSGRHSGPNARSFATMANRDEVRQILKKRGLDISDDTWFLGIEHNTCDEKLYWYDDDLVPKHLQEAYQILKKQVYHASQLSAHERCRRLASAPKNPTKEQALSHIIGRSYDISQARPELGHATNAICFIGRRSATQGAFFDRRIFLISYDSSTDPSGDILEKILLAAGPVGAGINLEYYFSTVDNESYGSGSKVTHNLNGLFGVMDGGFSDLRTGLPKQMIEIHEAMRLQIVVEHSEEVLTRIYTEQPALQELIGKGWILLTIKDPDSATLKVFKPHLGFVSWQGDSSDKLPEVKRSSQWYSGHAEALDLALIEQPVDEAVRGRQMPEPSSNNKTATKKVIPDSETLSGDKK